MANGDNLPERQNYNNLLRTYFGNPAARERSHMPKESFGAHRLINKDSQPVLDPNFTAADVGKVPVIEQDPETGAYRFAPQPVTGIPGNTDLGPALPDPLTSTLTAFFLHSQTTTADNGWYFRDTTGTPFWSQQTFGGAVPTIQTVRNSGPAEIHIVQDATRPESPVAKGEDGDGTAQNPFNCISVDSIKSILENDGLVPPGSRVVIGPGTYEVAPVNGVNGININKDLVIQGSGRTRTIIKMADGRPSSATAGPVFAYRILGLGWYAPYSNPEKIYMSDLTLDANMAGYTKTVAHDANISQSGLRSAAEHVVLERVDFVGCGEFERSSETFHAIFDNQVAGSREGYVRMTDCRYYNEDITHSGPQKRPGDVHAASAFHIGGGPTNGKVSGVYENCTIHRKYSGVCYGISTSGRIAIKNCVQTSDVDGTNGPRNTGILHDTGVCDELVIDGCTLQATFYEYAIICEADTTLFRCTNTTFNRINLQGSSQPPVLVRDAPGFFLFDGNRVLGTANHAAGFIAVTTANVAVVNNSFATTAQISSAAAGAQTRASNNWTIETGAEIT